MNKVRGLRRERLGKMDEVGGMILNLEGREMRCGKREGIRMGKRNEE
jgi:hypothetical protein